MTPDDRVGGMDWYGTYPDDTGLLAASLRPGRFGWCFVPIEGLRGQRNDSVGSPGQSRVRPVSFSSHSMRLQYSDEGWDVFVDTCGTM